MDLLPDSHVARAFKRPSTDASLTETELIENNLMNEALLALPSAASDVSEEEIIRSFGEIEQNMPGSWLACRGRLIAAIRQDAPNTLSFDPMGWGQRLNPSI
jgi:hypothetical protein